MVVFLGIIIHIVSSSVVYSQSFSKNQLNIGVVLDADDDISRRVINSAIQNANIELEKFNFSLAMKTEILQGTYILNTIKKACDILQNGVVAIIDPISDMSSRHISSVCGKFHIPHLVTKCQLSEFSDAYPMDINTSPDCDQYANILYQYITKVEEWDDMIIFHSTDSCILKYEYLLNQFESRFKTWQWIHDDLQKNKNFLRKISQSGNYRHFLVDIPYWQITEFLIMASVHNMTSPQNSLIFADWDTNLVDITIFKINNKVNITTFSIMKDPSIIDQLKIDGKNTKNMLPSIVEVEKQFPKKESPSNFMTRLTIVFDSINLLAKALLNLGRIRQLSTHKINCSSNETWNLGPGLVNAMTSVMDADGMTGKLIFNERTRRKHYNLSVLELTEDGFKMSGHWNGNQFIMDPKITDHIIPKQLDVTNPLRVTTIVNEPFVFYKYGIPDQDNYDSDIEAWDGYCIELLNEISLDLSLNFTIHLVKDKTFGAPEENLTNADGSVKWNGMIGELISKEADLAVAPMTISYEREKVVDFTTPFMSLGLSILFLRPQKEAPGLFSFLSPLSPPVWIYVISAYVSVSVIIFLISHVTPYEYLKTPHCDLHSELENQFNLLNSLWFTTGALMRQGLEFCPQASSTRMVSGAWWIFTLIIISTYTANLAAFLTVEQLILPIKSVEDLVNQTKIRYGTLKGGSSEQFFENSNIPTYKKMFQYMEKNPDVLVPTTSDGINKVLQSNGKYAFLLESVMNDYYAQRDCKLIRVGDLLDSKGYGIGFPAGSKLRNPMTESILKMQKSQKLAMLRHKWWKEINVTQSCDIKEKTTYTSALNFQQVGGIFLLLGAGFIFAILVAIIELYVDYCTNRYRQRTSFHKYLLAELKFAMRFMSSSRKSAINDVPFKRCSEITMIPDHPTDLTSDVSFRIFENPIQSNKQFNHIESNLNIPVVCSDSDSPCVKNADFISISHDTLVSFSNLFEV